MYIAWSKIVTWLSLNEKHSNTHTHTHSYIHLILCILAIEIVCLSQVKQHRRWLSFFFLLIFVMFF